ncbi:ABC transporter permease [Pelagibacterium lacus]|uniref:Iron ABC transporter permease n=1 Tax=Pelagibacterium lacus TaxID=2282655 RepID=A0A369W1A3_9HYPH|nr:iron ABC transporter permease [Pelagibacterium lacus]RDE07819.1 iron ABC transporter permease [Pelagibacterium lacus]
MAADPAPAASRPILGLSGEHILLAGLFLYVGILVALPLGRLFSEALRPDASGAILGVFFDSLANRAVSRALGNTVITSLAATALSVAIGTLAAIALRLTDMPGRTALMFLMLMPMLIPSQISALAWIELSGPSSPLLNLAGLAPPPGTTNPLYSMGGIIWVMGLEHAPLVLLAVAAGMAAVPRDLIEAGRIVGARPWRLLVSIVLPALGPSILAGAALSFVSAIGNFGVPALLGIPGRVTVLTTLIYQRLNGFGPSVLGQVATVALVLVGLAAIGLGVRAFASRFAAAPLDRTGAPLEPFRLGRFRAPAALAFWMLAILIAILPLVALIASALVPALGVRLSLETLSLANFEAVLRNPAIARAFSNSFFLALATAIICAAVSVPLAYLSVVRKNPLAWLLDALADAPYAVPGTVVALATIIVFLPPLPVLGISIYGTFWIVLVAYLSRFLLLALRPVGASLASMDRALDEVGRIVGAHSLSRLVFIVLPIALPSALAGALLIFMTAINELTLSALLWSTGTETLGVMVFFLQYEGNSPSAAALASVIVVFTLGLALVIDLIGRRFVPGVVPWQVR